MSASYFPTATVIPIAEVGRARRKVRSTPKGRAVDAKALHEVQALLGDSPRRRDLLIEFLHRIQDTFGHITAAHIVALAQEMKLAMTEVYEVATFYHHFDVVKEGETAPPALTVRVCETLSCAMAGSGELLRDLQQRLGSRVRVVPAPCIGRCDGAPAVTVGRHAIDRATVEAIETAVKFNTVQAAVADYVTYADYRKANGYQLLAGCVAGRRSADEVIATLESSSLRGLGGAGFPAGRKWKIVRAEPAPRLMAVNIDEGEPGTFKDRVYLERDPHRFLEGMLIAAWAVGIDAIYVYLRDEYAGCREILARELSTLTADPPCPLPTIELRRGAGAYICGEESAMIESIEGKRGMPRLRPPYVAQVGLFGRPTLEHNMETLYWVRDILEKGVADAVTFPWGSIPLFGIDKVTKYHMDAPLYVTTFAFVFNKAKYNEMSAAQKKVIDDHCTNAWALKVASPWADFEHNGIATLKSLAGHEVYTLSNEQLAEWRKAAEPLEKAWADNVRKAGGNPDQIMNELKDQLSKLSAAY